MNNKQHQHANNLSTKRSCKIENKQLNSAKDTIPISFTQESILSNLNHIDSKKKPSKAQHCSPYKHRAINGYWSFITKKSLKPGWIKIMRRKNNKNQSRNMPQNNSGYFNNKSTSKGKDNSITSRKNNSLYISLNKSLYDKRNNDLFLNANNKRTPSTSSTTRKHNYCSKLHKSFMLNFKDENSSELYIKHQKNRLLQSSGLSSSKILSPCEIETEATKTTSTFECFSPRFKITNEDIKDSLTKKETKRKEIELSLPKEMLINNKMCTENTNSNKITQDTIGIKIKTNRPIANNKKNLNAQFHYDKLSKFINKAKSENQKCDEGKNVLITPSSIRDNEINNDLYFINYYPSPISYLNKKKEKGNCELSIRRKSISPHQRIISFLFHHKNKMIPSNNKSKIISTCQSNKDFSQRRFNYDLSSLKPISLINSFQIYNDIQTNKNDIKHKEDYAIYYNENVNFINEKRIEEKKKKLKDNITIVKEQNYSLIKTNSKSCKDLEITLSQNNITQSIPSLSIMNQPKQVISNKPIENNSWSSNSSNSNNISSENLLQSVDEKLSLIKINKKLPKLISSIESNKVILIQSMFEDTNSLSTKNAKHLNMHQLLSDMKTNSKREYDIIISIDYQHVSSDSIDLLTHYNDQNILYGRALLFLKDKISKNNIKVIEIIVKNLTLQAVLLNELIGLIKEKELVNNINLITDLINKNKTLFDDLLLE